MNTTPTFKFNSRIFASLALAALCALLFVSNAHGAAGTIWQWDGGAGNDDWTSSNNWNPNAPNAQTNGTFNNTRLNVNGTQKLTYRAAQGTTVYAPTSDRGLVIGSGTSGSGTMEIIGGSFSTLGASVGDVIGNSGNTGTLIINGGSYTGTAAGTGMGIGACTSVFTINSGSATVATLNYNNTTGTLSLNNGGTLSANAINRTAGTATFDLNGGTLKPRVNTTTFLQGLTRANVRNNGAVIDTDGKNITIAQALLHSNVGGDNATDGGLTKNGLGTLTLSGTSTYNGGTVINVGTLALGNTTDTLLNTGAINVNGGTLDIGANSDTVGAVTLTSGSITGSGGTLTGSSYGVQSGSVTAILGGSGVVLTKTTSGTVTLSGANTYTGNTVVSAGTLALGASGSLAANSSVSLAAGGTFDVSAIASYTWGASAALTASGTGTTVGTDAAELKGGATGVDLGSRPVTLNFTPASFSGDSTHPALYVSAGTLTINSAITINNQGGTPLGDGTYVLIQQASGSISGSPTRAGLVGGSGIAAGKVAVLQVNGGNVELVVQDAISTTTTLTRSSGTGDSTTYGDVLSFDVSVSPSAATGTVELRNGGAAGTLIGSGTLSGGACTVSPAETALAVGSHANIVAVYLGDSTYGSSTSSALSPAQSVAQKPLTISSASATSKYYDGTTTATVSGSLTSGGGAGEVESGDTVSVSTTGTFASAGPGTGISVTFALTGPSVGNYTPTQPGVTADIYEAGVWTGTAANTLWNTVGNWNPALVPAGANVTVDFTTLDLTADQVVNLDSARTIGNLKFGDTDTGTAASWTLANNSTAGNILTLAGTTPTVTVNALGTDAKATISAVVAGSDGLTKAGAGTLVLSAANTFSGTATIGAGTVVAQNNAAFGATSQGTTVNGGTIDLGGALAVNTLNLGAEVVTISGTGAGGVGTLINSSANTQINAVRNLVLADHAAIGGSGRWDVRGSGASVDMAGKTLTKKGSGYIAMVGTSFSNPGHIDVVEGTLGLQTSTSIGGTSANTVTVRNGASLENYQATGSQAWTMILDDGATFWAESGTGSQNTWSGPVTLNGAATLKADGAMTLSGAITGASGSLNKTGAGTLILNSTAGANTYGGGTTITSTSGSSSTLQLGANNQIPDGSLLTFAGGSGSGYSYFNMQGFTETVDGISDSTTHGVTQNSQTGGPAATTLTINNSADYSYNGLLRDNASGTSPLALTKQGAGKQTLSGANIKYTGTTTISDGTLTLADTTAFNSDITDDSVLELNRSSSTWTLIKTISGTGSLTKSGAGTVTLSPTAGNSYQGGTAINEGVLSLGTAGAIGTVGTISFGGGTLQFSSADTSDYSARFSSANNQAFKLDVPSSLTVTLASGLSSSGGTLAKSGAGTLLLSVANSYDGATAVTGGYLAVGDANGLGSGTTANVSSGAALRVDVPNSTSTSVGLGKTLTIAGNGPNVYGALQGAASTSVTWAGDVVLGANEARIGGGDGGTLTVEGVIGDGGNGYAVLFSRAPNSTTVLNSVNTYTGDTLFYPNTSTVTLKMGIANAINSASRVRASIGSAAGDAYFDLNGFDQKVRALVDDQPSNLIVINNSTTDDAVLTLTEPTGANSHTFGGWIQDGGTRKVSVVKAGAGTQVFTGANTYTGDTTISGGTLALSGSGSIASTVMAITNSARFEVSAISGTGYTLPVGSLTLAIDKTGATLTQGQVALGAKTLAYNGTLTVVSNANSEAFADGDSFTLVSKTSGTLTGWFSSVSLPDLVTGLAWDTNKLATTGVLDIYSFTFSGYSLTALKDTAASFGVAKLLAKATSARSSSLSVAGVSGSSAQGGTVALASGSITYTPPASYTGSDSFTCVIGDGNGSITVTVTVTVVEDGAGTTSNLAITALGGSTYRITLAGTVGRQYKLEYQDPPGSWTELVTLPALTSSVTAYDDTSSSSTRLYRAVLLP
jgi:autotransporter-associated beta strand protein